MEVMMVVKVNVSLPGDLLDDLDRAAKEKGSSRSALLSQAARKYLEDLEEQRRREQRLKAAQAIRRLASKIGPWDGTSEILNWRDAH
jgi:metal-responsive CopG/Arc/MetJ family transcriptional regulator